MAKQSQRFLQNAKIMGGLGVLSRQQGDAIAIYKSKESLLNSKKDYVTNCIARITVQEGAIKREMRYMREEEEEK